MMPLAASSRDGKPQTMDHDYSTTWVKDGGSYQAAAGSASTAQS